MKEHIKIIKLEISIREHILLPTRKHFHVLTFSRYVTLGEGLNLSMLYFPHLENIGRRLNRGNMYIMSGIVPFPE